MTSPMRASRFRRRRAAPETEAPGASAGRHATHSTWIIPWAVATLAVVAILVTQLGPRRAPRSPSRHPPGADAAAGRRALRRAFGARVCTRRNSGRVRRDRGWGPASLCPSSRRVRRRPDPRNQERVRDLLFTGWPFYRFHSPQRNHEEGVAGGRSRGRLSRRTWTTPPEGPGARTIASRFVARASSGRCPPPEEGRHNRRR